MACSAGTDTLDICNGSDDDCDASSADGSEDPGLGAACDGTDSDLCEEGTTLCSAGSIVCSDTTGDNVEVCDGIDNDCNGAVDDGITCVDYDVVGFRCSHGTAVGKTTKITVVIKNMGTTNPGALLTVTGSGPGGPISIVAGASVSDPVGGGRTTYTYTYSPTSANVGTITWSVSLTDGDPDTDNGMCETIVKP